MRDELRELILRYSYREGDFTLASGKKSRYYVDVRRTSLTAEGAWLIGNCLLDALLEKGWKPDAVGGLTLGADPLTTALCVAAAQRGYPMTGFIVRKEAKGHGAAQQIERAGDLADGARVVVLDDTCTTGGSTLKAVEVMRAAGFEVIGAACVVDREEGAAEALAEAGVALAPVFTLSDLKAP